MRITSGTLGGRTIKSPPDIRPTQDKVRQALFSSLGEHVVGARVLDLYAGTGAIGIEAWSRGAESVCWVERDPKVYAVLCDNVRKLCGEDRACRTVRMDALQYLQKSEDGPYDLVLADPPYGSGVLENALRLAGSRSILKIDGIFVFEQGAKEEPIASEGWRLASARRYGEAKLLIYVKTHETSGDISRNL